MARFEELVENGGVTVQDQFMAVGLHGFNLVALKDAQGFNVIADDPHMIELSRVTPDNVGRVSVLLRHQFKSLLMSDDDAKAYLAAMFNVVNAGPSSQLWLVKGKAKGRTGITARRGRQSVPLGVWVLPPKRFTIGFRFVRMYDEHKNHQSLTKFTHADAPRFVDELNAVYGMQANISFKLADAAILSLTVNSEDIFHDEFVNYQQVVAIDYFGGETPKKDASALKYFEFDRSKNADVTIFVVFRYQEMVLAAGGRPTVGPGISQTFPEKQICIVEDTPPQNLVIKGEDAFLVFLAHEVAHFLNYRLIGTRANIHHGRQGILLCSTGIESIRMDSGVVGRVNLVK